MVESLQSQIEQILAKKKKYKKLLKAAERKNEVLDEGLKTNEQLLNKQNDEFKIDFKLLKKLRAKNKDLQEETRELKDKVQVVSSQLVSAEASHASEISRHETQVSELSEMVNRLTESNSELRSKLSDMIKDREADEKQMNDLKKEITQYKSKVVAIHDEQTVFKKSLNGLYSNQETDKIKAETLRNFSVNTYNSVNETLLRQKAIMTRY